MTATEQQQDEYADIRNAVAKLCAQFPGEYWRKLDREMKYPSEFVDALTQAGYLSVLIPEEYDGAGLKLSAAAAILEEIQRAGCNGAHQIRNSVAFSPIAAANSICCTRGCDGRTGFLKVRFVES